jgi:1,4-dihydroxy-6-naphthoate synthase
LARLIDFWQEVCAQNRTPDLPLPLGGNAIKKSLGAQTIARLAKLMQASIACAREHHAEARDYARQFKRDLSDAEADLYLSWYANERTLEMGEAGRAALELLYATAFKRGLLPKKIVAEIF